MTPPKKNKTHTLYGVAASPGIALGPIYSYREERIVPQRTKIPATSADEEAERFLKSLKTVGDEIVQVRKKLIQRVGEYEAGIFDAHVLILKDPEIIKSVTASIKNECINAEFAFSQHINQLILKFDSITDQYLHERVSDLRSISERVLQVLRTSKAGPHPESTTPTVMVARNFPLFAMDQMHKANTLGYAVEYGGKTSHFSILARSMEIPAVTGVPADAFSEGDYVIIDGTQGIVVINPSPEQIDTYRNQKAEYEKAHRKLLLQRGLKSQTSDGKNVRLMANMELPIELDRILRSNAEGIGLFRSEYLILTSSGVPSEEEQYRVYAEIGKRMGSKPFVVRTFDSGGDKLIPGIQPHSESNPFMGWRSIRVCLDNPDLFKGQLRAILRASVRSNIQVMFPMISGVSELLQAKGVLKEVMDDLKREGKKFNSKIKVGCMIEIPSAVLQAPALAAHCDFMSVGTNDLVQFTLAVDRGNEKISKMFDPHHPSVLKLLQMAVKAALARKIPISICGEMAGDPLSAVLLMGMGVEEFSMNVHSILEMRKFIRSISSQEAVKVWRQVSRFQTGEEINKYLLSKFLPLLNSYQLSQYSAQQ